MLNILRDLYLSYYFKKALARHLEYRSAGKDQIAGFVTFSPADQHWHEFHSMIPKAHELYLHKKVSIYKIMNNKIALY